MTVQYLEMAYQYDVTYISTAINSIVAKIQELAKEHMVTLPPEVQQYQDVDLASITEILRNVSLWQTNLVNAIGLPVNLKPKQYEHVDYNDIVSLSLYYGTTLNKIIQSADNIEQNPPVFES